MAGDVTVVVPRKDLADRHRNAVQKYCHRLIPDVPVVTATYPPDGRLWSMSRALNAGRDQVTTPKMIVTPADYELTPDMIARASDALDAHGWWGPFYGVWQVPRTITLRVLRHWSPLPDREGMEWWGLCIAATAVRVDVFDDVGGMDPRFEGWGPEDAALRVKLRILHGEPAAPEFAASELWCDRPPPVNNEVTCALYAQEYMTLGDAAGVRSAIERGSRGHQPS